MAEATAIPSRPPRSRPPEVRVSALTARNQRSGELPETVPEQCREALAQGAELLAAAGLTMNDVVRITYLMLNTDGLPGCYAMLRTAFGEARPASTLHLVGGFNRPDVKIELELTARRAA